MSTINSRDKTATINWRWWKQKQLVATKVAMIASNVEKNVQSTLATKTTTTMGGAKALKTARVAVMGSKHDHLVGQGQVATWYCLILARYFFGSSSKSRHRMHRASQIKFINETKSINSEHVLSDVVLTSFIHRQFYLERKSYTYFIIRLFVIY